MKDAGRILEKLEPGDEFTIASKTVAYVWEPKEDITAYELACCVHIFLVTMSSYGTYLDYEMLIEALPEKARRHFRKKE